jgi:hypothetical protein
VDAVLPMIADDALFTVAGAEPFGKKEFEAQARKMKDVRMDGRTDILEIEVLGDRAWMRGHITVRMNDMERKRAEGKRWRSRVGAEKALRAIYLIEEIARAKELRITQEDIEAELSEIARRNGTKPEEVAAYYKEQGLLRQLGLEMLEHKVRRYLRTSAAIRQAT